MHTRFSFTIDRKKFDKLPSFNRSWVNQSTGETVQVEDVRLEFVPSKNGPEVIRRYEDKTMLKVGFIAEPTTKAEREAGKKGLILGDAIVFEPVGGAAAPSHSSAPPQQKIPF